MNPNDPNVVMMELVAERLGDGLREELVFVGGAVTGLLITDPAQPAIRPTEDVDLIVEATVRADYAHVEKTLPGHLPGDAASQARLPDLEDKLRLLVKLD